MMETTTAKRSRLGARSPSPGRASRGRLGAPLFRLLVINLLIGVVVAVLLVGGLLLLNPGGLRHLIFTDRSPFVAIGLLLFGFIVTFGSAAMGSAIMATGEREEDDAPRGPGKLVARKVEAKGRM